MHKYFMQFPLPFHVCIYNIERDEETEVQVLTLMFLLT